VSTTRRGSGRKEEKPDMPTYVYYLFNWTDQGIRNVRDTVHRCERSQELQDKISFVITA